MKNQNIKGNFFFKILIFTIFTSSIYSENKNILLAKESVVRVVSFFGGKVATGTAFCIDENGYFLTNYHVVYSLKTSLKASDIIIIQQNENKTTNYKYKSKVIWESKDYDLAVIKVDNKKFKPLTFASNVSSHQKVTAIGFPTNGDDDKFNSSLDDIAFAEPSFTSGVIARIFSKPLLTHINVKVVQTDTAINHGNSGGPLLNECGEVVAINESRAIDTSNIIGSLAGDVIQGINFAVHKNEAIKLLTSQNIPFKQTSSSCNYIDSNISNRLNLIIILFIFIIGLISLFLLQNRKKSLQKVEVSKEKNEIILTSLTNQNNIIINKNNTLVGRSNSIDFTILNSKVSSKHLEIIKVDNTIYIKDLNSTNGTYINGIKLIPFNSKVLYVGDKLIIASEQVVYQIQN